LAAAPIPGFEWPFAAGCFSNTHTIRGLRHRFFEYIESGRDRLWIARSGEVASHAAAQVRILPESLNA
jgi:hypothetical protein